MPTQSLLLTQEAFFVLQIDRLCKFMLFYK